MKKFAAFLISIMLVLSMVSVASADTLSDIKEKGTLVVGASVAFPPYEFYWTNPETGVEEPAGFDMSLAKGIADELGVELVIADQSFAGLITALRAGEIDMIISGMAIREDRLEVVDFTMPYYTGAQIMLVRSEDFDTLKTVEDMTGKKVGAQLGGLQVGILEEQFANAEPYVMEKVPLMILDLLQGQLDGVLLADMVAKNYMVLNPGMLAISEVPGDYNTSGGAGVAVAKGDNEALLEVLNAYIEKVTTDGTFDSWVDLAVEQNAKLVAEAEAAAAEATAAPAETGTKTE